MDRDARRFAIAGLVYERVALGATLRFRIASSSMSPLIEPGDEVVVAAASTETLRPGDIVVAAVPGRPFVVHRLVAIRREGDAVRLVTRGDRSSIPDPAWSTDAVVGRAVAVIRAGRTLDLIRGRGRAVMVMQGWLARLEAVVYGVLRGVASALLGRWMPRSGWLVRAPFRALARLISQVLR
jgi:signal peptidase I